MISAETQTPSNLHDTPFSGQQNYNRFLRFIHQPAFEYHRVLKTPTKVRILLQATAILAIKCSRHFLRSKLDHDNPGFSRQVNEPESNRRCTFKPFTKEPLIHFKFSSFAIAHRHRECIDRSGRLAALTHRRTARLNTPAARIACQCSQWATTSMPI